MDTALNDAVFRLVTHSQVTIDANFRAPRTDEARLAALRVQFRDARPEAIAEALERARLLEETAIEMADAFRGPELTRETLAERCPGFSDESYGCAVNDGFTATRK